MQFITALAFAASVSAAAISNGTTTSVYYSCAPDSASNCSPVTTVISATGSAAATSTAGAAGTDCVSKYDVCRQPTNGVSANQAYCASQNAQCQGDCYAAYNTCRTGANANMATCASGYASCLGENPFASNGTNTIVPYTASAAATGGAVYTTEVVTALTTYCPAATTLTVNNKVYTVSSATTLTITDCPCTVTKASSMPTGSATMSRNGTATTSMPVKYTGAAAHLAGAGSGLVAALGAAVVLL